MLVRFDGLARPARVAKILKHEMTLAGHPVGLARAQDVAAQSFGYGNYRELRSLVGKGPASAWDEDCPAGVVAARRARQVEALVGAGLDRSVASGIVGRLRPSARTLGDAGKGEASRAGPGAWDRRGRVLTAPGEALALPARMARYVAAIDDGTLLVARSFVGTEPVSEAVAAVERHGFVAGRTLLVDLEDIRKAYDRHALARLGLRDGQPPGFPDILAVAAAERARAVHVIAGPAGCRVEIEVDGAWRRLPLSGGTDGQALCREAFSIAEISGEPFDPSLFMGGRITASSRRLPPRVQAVRLQGNPIPGGGCHLVARLLYHPGSDAPSAGPGGSRLSIGEEAAVARMRRRPCGLNILAGAAGSGKATTLRGILADLDGDDVGRVMVVEGETTPRTPSRSAQHPGDDGDVRREAFRSALSHALSTEPGVVMIGEVNDISAADLAFQAAMTGHQTWATIQARDAIAALQRLSAFGVESRRLCDATLVTGVLAQASLRRLCGNCSLGPAEAVSRGHASPLRVTEVHRAVGAPPRFARPEGCPSCREGHEGRVIVAEAILPDQGFLDLFANGDVAGARRRWLGVLGGVTLRERAASLVADGVVDPDEADLKVGPVAEVDPDRPSGGPGVRAGAWA